jgi:hypothetical protein
VESRAAWNPVGTPTPPGRQADLEKAELRALGSVYADHAGAGDGVAWPTLGELAACAALAPEAVPRALRGLERWGLLRLRPGVPRPATIVRGPPLGAPQPAGGAVPASPGSAETGPYSAGGSTPSALASFRTVTG